MIRQDLTSTPISQQAVAKAIFEDVGVGTGILNVSPEYVIGIHVVLLHASA